MTEEKRKRSLRRLRNRIASRRRKRLTQLRNFLSKSSVRSLAGFGERRLQATQDVMRSDGTRLLTRQEMRVQEQFEQAVSELGLT